MEQRSKPFSDAEMGRAQALARGITSYLAEHPRARDTADGIRLWWLRDPGSVTLGEVERVLEDLVRRGRMARTTLADGRTVYGRLRA